VASCLDGNTKEQQIKDNERTRETQRQRLGISRIDWNIGEVPNIANIVIVRSIANIFIPPFLLFFLSFSLPLSYSLSTCSTSIWLAIDHKQLFPIYLVIVRPCMCMCVCVCVCVFVHMLARSLAKPWLYCRVDNNMIGTNIRHTNKRERERHRQNKLDKKKRTWGWKRNFTATIYQFTHVLVCSYVDKEKSKLKLQST
jgi:hypothetical protein